MYKTLILLILCLGKIQTNTTRNDYNSDHRIVGGQRCSVADHKYMIALLISGTFSCGGSLLSSRWVLTARHCLSDWTESDSYMVVAGVEAPYENYWGKDMQSSIVKDCYEHPTGDIGLMHLQKSIEISPVVGYVTLATYSTMQGRKLEDICANSSVMGWGLQHEVENEWRLTSNKTIKPFDPYLQCVNLPVISAEECNKRMEKGNEDIVTDSNFCAFKKNADACFGDSGGPLLCNGIQYGIVSYGPGCAYKNFPGVYVKVYYFEKFITDTMRKENATISRHRSCSAVKHSFLMAIIHHNTVNNYEWEWECAGSLLTQQWVLTSGFCTMNCKTPNYYTVVAGLNDPFKFDLNDESTISSQVVGCFRSPDQNELRDIALMKLENQIHPSEKVSFIRFVTLLEMKNKNFKKVCSNGTLVGYGRPNPLLRNLQCDKTTITSDKKCKNIWSSANIGDELGCIDGLKGGDCSATLGVPLVCHGIQYGVLSSIACAERIKPNSQSILIAKVYKYDLFLHNVIYGKNINESNMRESNGNMNTTVKLQIFILILGFYLSFVKFY